MSLNIGAHSFNYTLVCNYKPFHIPLNTGVRLRRVDHIRPTHLRDVLDFNLGTPMSTTPRSDSEEKMVILYTHTRMANSTLKCRIIILFTARSFYSYVNILIDFGQLYSNSCYTTFSIATLGMCIACEFHQLWAVRPCIYHIFRHLIK